MKVFSKEIKSKEDFDSLLEEIQTKPLRGRYAYVKYIVDRDNFSLVDKKAIEQTLKEQEPLSIVGIVPKVICTARQRDATLTETLDGETALEKWLANKQAPDDRVKSVMQKYRTYVEQISLENSGEA